LRADGRDEDFVGAVEAVNKLWQNSLRYADQRQAFRWLREKRSIGSYHPGNPAGICKGFFA
jgi:hypothetical protein